VPSPSFETAYAQGALADFFQLAPGDTRSALERACASPRAALTEALRRGAEKLGAPGPVWKSLERLAHPESRVVVTGQQTGLLLGPLYTLSKAVTAVALAQRLSTEARPVVPVFWLASQDADSAEIDHAYLLDLKERLHQLRLPLPEGVCAGRVPLQEAWLEVVLRDLGALDVQQRYRREVADLLRRTAARAETFSDWFGALLYELLGPAGLIVLDPMACDMAALFRPTLEAELAAPLRSVEAIGAAAAHLKRLGWTPQLGRGAGATNLFVEEAGQRRALRVDGRGFRTERAYYTAAELRERLRHDPCALTPAAGLRPVTQDAVLPTAATVVGPGELRYFALLRGVYEAHGVAMPLIWPRASVTVLEPPVRRILEKFGLSAGELQRDFEGVRGRKLLELHGHKAAFDKSLAALKRDARELAQHVSGIDPTLLGAVARAEARLEGVYRVLEAKSAAALAARDDLYTRQFGRLRAHLLPNGAPQERVLSPFSFFLKFGVQPVIAALLALPPEGEHELRL
jgi:bacillithiol biosynthesis cysteine-adding enzyme BshC